MSLTYFNSKMKEIDFKSNVVQQKITQYEEKLKKLKRNQLFKRKQREKGPRPSFCSRPRLFSRPEEKFDLLQSILLNFN
jgi:hypothetical protein